MSGQQALLKLLEVISQRVQHHHDALWEEEKHYSWWIYIIFGGLIYLYLRLPSFTALEPYQQALLMSLGSVLGVFISIMGYHAVRREGEMFHKARKIRKRILAALEIEQSIIQDFDSIEGEANKSFWGLWKYAIVSLFSAVFSSLCGLLARVFKKKPNENKKSNNTNFSIRDGFQLTFLITALLFIGFGIFSVATLLQNS